MRRPILAFAGRVRPGLPPPTDPDLFRENPRSELDPAYLQNQIEAAAHFDDILFAPGPVTGAGLKRALSKMHRIAAVGERGDRPYHWKGRSTLDLRPGEWHEGLRGPPPRRPDASEYALAVKRQLGLPESVEVGVEGLAGGDDAQPANGPKGLHFYPTPTHFPAYFALAARRLQAVKARAPGSPRWTDALADYYHTLINARAYRNINQSILITQVNTILRRSGHPGIQGDGLDHLAHRSTSAEFRVIFRARLAGTLPTMSDLGLGGAPWDPRPPVAPPRAARTDVPPIARATR